MKNLDFQTAPQTQAFIDSDLSFKRSNIKYSNLLSINGSFNSNCIGIKYVFQGTEKYYLNSKDYHVNSGQFLIVNSKKDFECSFKQKEIVKGACISLSVELIEEAYDYLLRTEESRLDNPIVFETTLPEFYETVYSQSESFGKFILKALHNERTLVPEQAIDLYQQMAIQLLISQKSIQDQLNNIKAAKVSTIKELYNRVYQAKIIIDSTQAENLNIPALAKECALSEFHFYRSFKKAFGVSPYQYVISQKLERAKDMLATSNIPITDVAYQAGFTDIYSFSRSFKKKFKISPTIFKQRPSIIPAA